MIVSVLMAACLPASASAYCLEYGPNSLTGTLVPQTYAGPPDYKSVTRGDEPRVIWVLLLDQPICVAGSRHPRYPRQYNEREVQLILEQAQYEQYRNLLGRKVTVIGTLQHGHADYKRLLIVPDEIARTRLGLM